MHCRPFVPNKLLLGFLLILFICELAHGSVSSGAKGPRVCLNLGLRLQGESLQVTRPSLDLAAWHESEHTELDVNTASKIERSQFDNRGQSDQDSDLGDNKKNTYIFFYFFEKLQSF